MEKDVDEFLGSPDVEVTTTHFECGIGKCQHRWELTLLTGEKQIPVCPECGNQSQQQVCG